MPTGPGREEMDVREKFRLTFVQAEKPQRLAEKPVCYSRVTKPRNPLRFVFGFVIMQTVEHHRSTGKPAQIRVG